MADAPGATLVFTDTEPGAVMVFVPGNDGEPGPPGPPGGVASVNGLTGSVLLPSPVAMALIFGGP